MELLPLVRRECSHFPISAIPAAVSGYTRGRSPLLTGLAVNDDVGGGVSHGDPHEVALLRLHNINCAWINSLFCLCHSVVRRQKNLAAQQNQYLSKHAAHTGILIHILDVSYKLIHVCPLACLPFGKAV